MAEMPMKRNPTTIIRDDAERVIIIRESPRGDIHLTIELPQGDEDNPGVFCVLRREEASAIHQFLADYLAKF